MPGVALLTPQLADAPKAAAKQGKQKPKEEEKPEEEEKAHAPKAAPAAKPAAAAKAAPAAEESSSDSSDTDSSEEMLKVDRKLRKYIKAKYPDSHKDISKNLAEAEYFNLDEAKELTMRKVDTKKIEGRSIGEGQARKIIKMFKAADEHDCPSATCGHKMVCAKKEVPPRKAVHSVWSRR
jgi:hypothetical protein